MADPNKAATKRLIALLLMASAGMLSLVAGLIYAGVVPLPLEVRGAAALVVGVAAAADFLIGLWFFRMGQTGAPSTRSVRDGVESS